MAADNKDGSELKVMLAEELARRKRFSERLLQYFNRDSENGDTAVELFQQIRLADDLIYTLIEKCTSQQSEAVEQRQKEVLSDRRNVDSGVVSSEEDRRRYGIRFSNPEGELGLAELSAPVDSLVGEIAALQM